MRGVVVNLVNEKRYLFEGDAMLDPDEGVLIVNLADGTSRVFNWSFVVDYYTLTEAETEKAKLRVVP